MLVGLGGAVFLSWTTDRTKAGCPLTTEYRRSSAAGVAGKPPSHRARASRVQTPERRAPPETAETPRSVPLTIRGREALPDSTESNSLSRFSAAPATAPRAAHLPPHRSNRRASRIQTPHPPLFPTAILSSL